ncbi:GNAT family N-acetyltransferase [Roseovarius sp. B08]|uniref:GNAT family N-acetyltransferase n=1 Tax=Roseovarius sp. B08 TaxID=3449223 RepID=UPI003EDC85A0
METNTQFEIRQAEQRDAAEIARLFLISSGGLATYIWRRLAGKGTTLEAVGAARYARTGTAFSYQNCLLATLGEQIAGMVHAFEMPETDAEEPETDPVLAPYAALEDPGSLYISGLAVHAPFRSHGIGVALLDCVEALAFTRALPRLSLICFERNTRAVDFYQRVGFRVADRRPIVPHPDLHYAEGDALLMTRSITGVRADGGSVHRRDVADSQVGSTDTQITAED